VLEGGNATLESVSVLFVHVSDARRVALPP